MCADRANVRAFLPDDVSPASIFATNPPTIEEVIAEACAFYRMPRDEAMTAGHRQASLVRNVIVHQARICGRLPHAVIGKAIGKSSQITMAAENKIGGRISIDEPFRDDMDILQRRIACAVIKRGPHASNA